VTIACTALFHTLEFAPEKINIAFEVRATMQRSDSSASHRPAAPALPEGAVLFGDYRLVPSERALLFRGHPVRLSGRAFDLLLALVDQAGAVVGKEELISRVWPRTFVEEGNLRVHIGALRKALGGAAHSYVENVVGRGYSFVAPVRHVPHPEPATDRDAAMPGPLPPASRSRVIGRDEVLDWLSTQLPQHRLVTIVGPGGMGKTTIASAVASRLVQTFSGHVDFADLAPLADARLLPSAIALSLGRPAGSNESLDTLIGALKGRYGLLVLDSCEHLIDAVAGLAERILRETSGIYILATSREPLRAEGEWVHRLQPLAVPAQTGGAAALEQLMACPAVQLFAERATAALGSFTLDADNAGAVADICRRLDGIPLAIELAAGRAEFFGVQGLAARLEDSFAVLTRGRRTALPRHQTLRATLDWSFDMLSPEDQAMLCRLSIFRGSFTLDAAAEVAHGSAAGRSEVFESIANLAAKSLVGVDAGGDGTLYRLLDTTRAYAMEKLRAGSEARSVAQRYARYYCALMASAEADWETLNPGDWQARYGRCIDHVRAALDWAFGSEGELAAGLELTAVSAALWYQLSLMEEYRQRLDMALARSAETIDLAPALAMQLHLALGHTLLHVGNMNDIDARSRTFEKALELAERLGDTDTAVRALWGCFTDALFRGEYRQAHFLTGRFGELARHGSPILQLAHRRMLARAMHYLGDQHAAREHVDLLMAHPLSGRRRPRVNGFQFDQRVSSLAIQGRVLWMQGYPEQAAHVARLAVQEGLELDHSVSLCFALLLACPVALWTGDLAAAGEYSALMLERSRQGALPLWQFWARAFDAAIQLHGGAEAGNTFSALERSPFCSGMHVDMLATLHGAMLTPRAIARADEGHAGWSAAEILRSWGEEVLQVGSFTQAEALFRRALATAREQGARAWELRAASSLARLAISNGGLEARREAQRELARVHGFFTEGQQSYDLRAAAALLRELA
jgi:predicted ATPase/DNA-binding winged helix-turn-helix (wHTH) protein